MTYSEIHVWGDSLARGVIYNEEKGRYAISRERCTARLKTALNCTVENHSNMGATVLDGLKCFEKFTPVPDALCAVEFGGNDCDLDWAYVAAHPDEPIAPKVSLALYKEKLSEFVTAVRARGMKPLLVTPLPLHAQRYFNWVTRGLDGEAVRKALGDVCHIYRWQERYALAVAEIGSKLNCTILNLREAFLVARDFKSLLCVDGIHPTPEGHRLIWGAVSRLMAGAQA